MGKQRCQPGLVDGTEEVFKSRTAPREGGSATSDRSGASTKLTSAVKLKSKARSKSKPRNKMITESKPIRNKIIAAVDYGTTYSGVAFVMTASSDARDVKVIADWAGAAGQTDMLEKVPSRIAFACENDELSEDKWGYEVKPSYKSRSWTKLLLDSKAKHREFDSKVLSGKVQSEILGLPKYMSAEQVVEEYLRYLYRHIMSKLEKQYGPEVLRITPIDFWFTHPATWQESSKAATRRAAEAAGFGERVGDQLYMISEPEAAATSILSTAIEESPGLYKAKTNVMIADLGGGTLDFQCLTVDSLNPLKMYETIMGEGGKSGSTYIDCNLHDWLKTTFGVSFTSLSPGKKGPGSKMMESWESVKKNFDGDLHKRYELEFPALGHALRHHNRLPDEYDFEDFNVILQGKDIAQFFGPVLENAFKLIEAQLASLKEKKQAPFEVLCLCGGLGSSKYVWKRFSRFCEEEIDGRCQLVTEGRAWSAVVRGAAVRGLDGSVVLHRISKMSYGIGVHQPFRKDIDEESDAFTCPLKGKRAPGYINWVIKKGKRFTPNLRVVSDLYFIIDKEDDNDDVDEDDYHRSFSWDLYSCDSDTPPIRVSEKGVNFESSINLDIPKRHKRQKMSDPCTDHEPMVIRIVFKLGSEKGILLVEALHERKVVGTARIDYGKSNIRKIVPSASLM